jgi:hypothetical protein
MDHSPFSTDQESTFSRTVAVVLVGALLVSTIAGAFAASPVAAQQQNGGKQAGGGDSVTKQEFRNWINKVMGMDSKGAAQEAARKNPDKVAILARAFKQNVDSPLSGTRLRDTIKKRPQYVINKVNQASGGGSFPAPVAPPNKPGKPSIPDKPGNPDKPGKPDKPTNPSKGPTSNESVNRIISEFKAKNLGYKQLSKKDKSKVNKILVALATKDLSKKQTNKKFTKLGQLFAKSSGAGLKSQRRQIITEHVGERERHNPIPKIDIDIPGVIENKLKALADTMREGAGTILGEIYDLAFSTSVPKNSGWHNILGEPTNKPFKPLYDQLLKDKLYPVLSYLLGMAVIVMGISVMVNPLMSRFQALDLTIKFTTFLLLYVSSWVAITLMHGSVNAITVWLRPSEQALGRVGKPFRVHLRSF